MKTTLSDESVVIAAKTQVSCGLGAEAAILDMAKGVYYGLDPVGAHIWTLLQTPQRVAGLRDAVMREYEVEPEQCRADVIELLERMLDEGLIQVQNG
jgi:hypothetical protein